MGLKQNITAPNVRAKRLTAGPAEASTLLWT